MVNRNSRKVQVAFDRLEEKVSDILAASNGFNAVVAINKDEEELANKLIDHLRELGYTADFVVGEEINVNGTDVEVIGKVYINWAP